jgi:hypothetical protein
MFRTTRVVVFALAIAVGSRTACAQGVTRGGVIDGVVSDTNLVPLKGVELTIQHTSIRVVTGENGRFRIRDVPSGNYLLVARRIGYRPAAQFTAVVAAETLLVSIQLERLGQSLDTVRITGDVTGFAWRRSLKVGQFITAADIERENPRTTTSLIRTRDGVAYSFDRAGNPFVALTRGAGRNCRPMLLLDGFPIRGGVPTVPGVPGLDWVLHPDEIGGVEIYANPAQVPPRFTNFGPAICGVIVFWTRERLGIPPQVKHDPP